MTRLRDSRADPAVYEATWPQVAAFRMHRHGLDERRPRRQMVAVLAAMAGAQSQLLSAAQMSLWARVRGLTAGDVERALWEERTVVRAWCMRRTLYLVPASEVSIFVRGSAARAEKEVRWLLNRGMPAGDLDRMLRATTDALDIPRTRSELAVQVARRLRLKTRTAEGGGWGNHRPVPCIDLGHGNYLPAYYLLHLAGATAVLCSGPSQDGEATFVRADRWLTGWRDDARSRSEEELLRRYLRAFGPANVDDFRAWTSMRMRDAKEIWSRVASELVPVKVGGWDAWTLRTDLDALTDSEPRTPVVRLLPYFDGFLLGHDSRAHLLDPGYHRRVYRPQGWVAPSMLVDGRVGGVWSHRLDGPSLTARIEPFERVTGATEDQLREEVADLSRFLGATAYRLEILPPGRGSA